MDKKLTTIESEIIELLRIGDKKAISLIYQNYSSSLYGIIVRIVPDEETATEVLQDSFMKIWKNCLKYDDTKGSLFTWMSRIVRNSAIDTFRSGKYQRGTKTDTLPDHVSNSTKHSESDHIIDSGLMTQVNSLESKYKQLIDLIYFKGFSHSEASKELELPLGTVKTRVRLAIIELRNKLGNEIFYLALFSEIVLNNLNV